MCRFVLAAFALTVLAGCQPATTELTEEQRAAIAAELNAIHTDMWDAWRAADYDQGVSYFKTEGLQFAYEGAVYDYSGFEELWRPLFENIASQVITIAESQTTVLSQDAVCIVDAGTYTVTDVDGVTTPEESFAFTGIWVNHEGEWKLSLMHESVPTPESQ
jgi:hypothetical protein